MTKPEDSQTPKSPDPSDIESTDAQRIDPDRAAALVVDADESLEDDPFQAFIDIRENSDESSQIRGTIVKALNASLRPLSVSESRENFLAEFAEPSTAPTQRKLSR
jgi:hypothetical protein